MKKIPVLRRLAHPALPALPIVLAGAFVPACAFAADKNPYKLEFKARLVHFDREFESSTNDRRQTGLGLQLNFESPYYMDVIGFGVSAYAVNKIDASGNVRTDVLKADGSGGFEPVTKLGQAFAKFKYLDLAQAKVGRQVYNSVLLSSSTSRAIPASYSGASGQFTPATGLKIYAAAFDRWSRRADDRFEKFRTDVAAEGDIKYVALVGGEYKSGPLQVNVEYLNSKDFISKFGVVGAYTMPLANKDKLKLKGGIHTSRDAGRLFVTGAEGGETDDEDVAGSTAGVTRSDNNGLGVYVEGEWTKGNLRLGSALAKFRGAWIEDNFSGDHGRNTFPTGGVLADFSNRDETVLMLRAGYDWKDYVKGLRTTVSVKRGTGATNSHVPALGSATEREFELDVRYKFASIKGLALRYRYLDYNSTKTGRIDGVKPDDTDHRIYLDYTYRFW